MTRLITRGFESGVLSDESDSQSGTNMETTVVRTGVRSVRFGSNGDWISWGIPSTDQVFLGGAHRLSGSLPTNNNHSIYRFVSSDSLIAIRLHDNGSVHFYRGNTDLAGSDPNVIVPDAWQYFEIWVLLANSGGRVQIKVDGVQIIDFTGDTLEGSSVDVITVFIRGLQSRTNYHDDVVINDDAGAINNTFPGIISLVPLLPTAAGFATELQRGGTDSGANWDQCNEVPADAVSYVFDTVVDDRDLFNIEDLTLPAGALIKNVIVQARCQIDSGSGNVAVMVRSGSTEDQSSDQILSAGWNLFQHLMDVNPDDSLAWEDADVDALQIGIKVR